MNGLNALLCFMPAEGSVAAGLDYHIDVGGGESLEQ